MEMLLESKMPDNKRSRLALSAVLVATMLLFAGCGGTAVPDVVPVTVVVKTKSGSPVNNVLVRFVPQAEGLDGNYIATGVTDKEGTCVLSFPGKEDEPGCCACLHKVQLLEGPPPEEARSAYTQDGGASIDRFEKTLKHRPLPKEYERLTTTTLTFTPSEDDSTFEITL
jgi:hypothetical protein